MKWLFGCLLALLLVSCAARREMKAREAAEAGLEETTEATEETSDQASEESSDQASDETAEDPAAAQVARVASMSLAYPMALSVVGYKDYLVAHLGDGGKKILTRIRKGTRHPLPLEFNDPKVIAIDSRRLLAFVIDAKEVKIVQLRKVAEPIQVVPIPAEGDLKGAAFSIQNRRLYVTEPASDTIWSVNPVKLTAVKVVGPDVFAKLGYHYPGPLLTSTDGTKLYVLATASTATAILSISLQKPGGRVIKVFRDVGVSALDTFKNRFVIFLSSPVRIETVDMKSGKTLELRNHEVEVEHPVTAAMDVNDLVVLSQDDNGEGSILRFPVKTH